MSLVNSPYFFNLFPVHIIFHLFVLSISPVVFLQHILPSTNPLVSTHRILPQTSNIPRNLSRQVQSYSTPNPPSHLQHTQESLLAGTILLYPQRDTIILHTKSSLIPPTYLESTPDRFNHTPHQILPHTSNLPRKFPQRDTIILHTKPSLIPPTYPESPPYRYNNTPHQILPHTSNLPRKSPVQIQ